MFSSCLSILSRILFEWELNWQQWFLLQTGLQPSIVESARSPVSVWVSSHTVPTHGSITDDTPLPVGVNVGLNGCLSQYVSSVMKWQYAAPAAAQRHRNRRVLSFQGAEGWNGFSVACVDPTPVGNWPQAPTLTVWAIPSSSSTQTKCNDLTNERKVD